MGVRRRVRDEGQMTVELAVALPVLVAVAAVAVNALLAFSECAAFDNAFRDAVRLNATSPAYGQGLEQSRAAVQSDLEGAFNRSFESVQVAVEGASGGHVRFTATLEVSPTLFGLGLKRSVFGVELPKLVHSAELAVDRYHPGMLV